MYLAIYIPGKKKPDKYQKTKLRPGDRISYDKRGGHQCITILRPATAKSSEKKLFFCDKNCRPLMEYRDSSVLNQGDIQSRAELMAASAGYEIRPLNGGYDIECLSWTHVVC